MMGAAPELLQALSFILIGIWMALLAAVLLRVIRQGMHVVLVRLHHLVVFSLLRGSHPA